MELADRPVERLLLLGGGGGGGRLLSRSSFSTLSLVMFDEDPVDGVVGSERCRRAEASPGDVSPDAGGGAVVVHCCFRLGKCYWWLGWEEVNCEGVSGR